MSQFTHVHTHSHYSLLQALPKIDELVEKAENHNLDSLALTDMDALYGAIEFYKACDEAGIKPIIGVELHLAPRTRFDDQTGVDKPRNTVLLLAKNRTGYENIIQIVTKANLEGFYYVPRADHELLAENSEGVIAITPRRHSEISSALDANDTNEAENVVEKYTDIFGSDDYYIEITRHPEIPSFNEMTDDVVDLAENTDTQLVAGHDIYYLDEKDHQACITLRGVQSGTQLHYLPENSNFSFLPPDEMEKRFDDQKKALENTASIAEKCNLELELGEAIFPDIDIPEDMTYDEQLRKEAFAGIERRNMEKTDELIDRFEYELRVIKNKGYSSYFLVVSDIMDYADENDIPTTIRGSVTGSLVTYLLGITNVDPIEYRLQFERFLNPQRPSAPDIDMDFADDRRDEVIAYVREKYGAEGEKRVAQIGTFGTMAARGSVRDVTRALGYSYDFGDKIAKNIPMGSQGFKMTIEKALEESDDLKEMYDNKPKVREVIDMAKKVEGCARHISVHAAGVVISPEDITNHVPLEVDSKKGEIITQYDMYSIDDEYGGVGLVKFDFLGLKNLAVLSDTTDRIAERVGDDIDIEEIDFADDVTFDLLSNGHTHSIFQLNGEGMTEYLKKLKPSNIHDINAMVALYRPGPMKFIPEYIDRKHNPEKIEYPHEDLEEVLEMSYGLLIYQEDVMLTAIKLADYSWLEADKFRKAMGKKKPELMKKQKEKFISGCKKNDISEELAQDLWSRIKPFAEYAFNKAHASSYGRVAYQTAYMKANYPLEYMAAVLTGDAGDVDKIADIINECNRMGIEVLPPNINESDSNFTVVSKPEDTDYKTSGKTTEDTIGQIRFGLRSIKHVGDKITEVLVKERKDNGDYDSLEDLLTRVTDSNLNKQVLEALIKSGALDDFAERHHMLAHLDELIEVSKQARERSRSQQSLFGESSQKQEAPSLRLHKGEKHDKDTRLQWEKQLLGLYVSGHPLDKIREQLKKRDKTIDFIKENHDKLPKAKIPGLIEEINEIRTKNGDPMAFLTITDLTDSIEVVVFPDTYKRYKDKIESESCMILSGKVDSSDGEINIIMEELKRIES
jgi:DNA polymerase-3 subunit alpha